MAHTESTSKNRTLRSVSVNGSIFWLLTSTVALLYTSLGLYYAQGSMEYVNLSAIVAVIDVVLAYEAWKQRRGAFLISWILSVADAVASFLLQGALSSIGLLVIVSQLMVAFYSSQAYQELRPDRVAKQQQNA